MRDGSHGSIILLLKWTEFNSLSKSNLYYHHLTEKLNSSKLYLTYKLGLWLRSHVGCNIIPALL